MGVWDINLLYSKYFTVFHACFSHIIVHKIEIESFLNRVFLLKKELEKNSLEKRPPKEPIRSPLFWRPNDPLIAGETFVGRVP